MQIIIPMAGLGERFSREGYQTPKPLLEIHGKPAIEHIVGLFPGDHDFVFICNDKHLKETEIEKVLKRIKPTAKIVAINQHKLGPVNSLLAAKEHIKDEPTIVTYCDIYIRWDFEHFQNEMQKQNHDACLVCFKGFHPPLTRNGFYAGVKEKENLEAEEVKEKHSYSENKMDSWSSAGVYYFKSGETLKKYLAQMLEQNHSTNNEYYVSTVHDLMITAGLTNGIYPVEYCISWGNPQDLREYLYWAKHFIKP